MNIDSQTRIGAVSSIRHTYPPRSLSGEYYVVTVHIIQNLAVLGTIRVGIPTQTTRSMLLLELKKADEHFPSD